MRQQSCESQPVLAANLPDHRHESQNGGYLNFLSFTYVCPFVYGYLCLYLFVTFRNIHDQGSLLFCSLATWKAFQEMTGWKA